MEGGSTEHPFVDVLRREFLFPLVLATDPLCYICISFGDIDIGRARALCRHWNIDPSSVTCPQTDSLCFIVPTERTASSTVSRA